jgi:hypothetical protein
VIKRIIYVSFTKVSKNLSLGSEFINMKQTENFKTASDRLREAQQMLLLAIEKGTISSMDRDLVLEKLRKAYDSILFENEVEQQVVTAPPASQPIKVKVEKVHEVPSKPKMPEVKPQVNPEPIHTQPKAQAPESPKSFERKSIFDPSVRSLAIEKVEEEMAEEQTEAKPKGQSILNAEQPESLAQKFQGDRRSMTDSLSNQFKTKPVASQLQDKPISDLTREIGVHDKFLFIKELFNGDGKSYEETVNRLNQFSDIAEALIYIQENFSWNEKNKAANKFIELIRRKLLND